MSPEIDMLWPPEASAKRLGVRAVIVECIIHGNPLYMSYGMLPYSDWVERWRNMEFGMCVCVCVCVCAWVIKSK